MSRRLVAVFYTEDAWILGCMQAGQPETVRVPRSADEADGASLKDWWQSNPLDHGPVILGVPSASCFSATVSTVGLPGMGRSRASALAYRLEDKLPLDVDTLTVRWLPQDDDRCVGVATQTDGWQQARRVLLACGVDVRHVVPAALLLSNQVSASAVLIQATAASVDYLTLTSKGRLAGWSYFPANVEALDAVLSEQTNGSVVTFGVQPALPDQRIAEQVVTAHDVDVYAAMTQTASDGLEKADLFPVRFEESADEAAASWRLWRPLVVAAMLLIWLTAGALHLRSARYQERIEQGRVLLREAYVQQFPGETAPAVILPRLRSLTQGLNTFAPGQLDQDVLPEAVLLWEVLALANDLDEPSTEDSFGLRLREFTLTTTMLQLGGEAGSLGALDHLALQLTEAEPVKRRGGLEPAASQVMPSGNLGFSLRSQSEGGAR